MILQQDRAGVEIKVPREAIDAEPPAVSATP